MKLRHWLIALPLALTGLVFNSCNEDIDLLDSGEETAVVYGLLNSADSIHYIKINKAFLTNDNSLVTASIADSNYFNQVDVVIKEVTAGAVTRTWNLQDTTIENKEPGVFYYPQQKLYYFKTTSQNKLLAEPNVEYIMEASINNGAFVISGKTQIVSGMAISNPQFNGSFSFAQNNVELNGYKNYTLNFNAGKSKRLEVNLQIIIDEHFNGNPVQKSFMWRVGTIDENGLNTGTPNKSMSINGELFYNAIKQNVTNDPSIDRRRLRSIYVVLTGASEDLNKYLTVNQPSSSLAQNKPTFTNLTATNGRKVIGIFSSRNTVYNYLRDTDMAGSGLRRVIDANSVKELCQGAITGNLLFCSSHPGDASPVLQSYFCD